MKFSCKNCSFSSDRKRALKRHTRTHRQICKTCGQNFPSAALLIQHRLKEHVTTTATQTERVYSVPRPRSPRRYTRRSRSPKLHLRRPKWRPAVGSPAPIPTRTMKSVIVAKAQSPDPFDSDPLCLVTSPVKINFT